MLSGPVAETVQERLDRREPDPRFAEELRTVAWIHGQVRAGNALPVMEAEAAAHSLHVALADPAAIPQLPLRRMAEYVSVHAINVSLLAMALGEETGLGADDVRDLGLAGLLHDIGMVRVPLELLAKPEQLSPAERDLVRQHPADGARLIIEADASLELAATVACEHHLRLDGSGYPALLYPREPHYAARLVQVCDVFHALHSPRPFRQPWPQDIILAFLNQRAGTEFDPELTRTLAATLDRRGLQNAAAPG